MNNYRYDMIGADLDYGIKLHPQEDMMRLGYKLVKSEPVPIADCWWFRTENEIENTPGYLHKMRDSFKFSDEKEECGEESGDREVGSHKRTPLMTKVKKLSTGDIFRIDDEYFILTNIQTEELDENFRPYKVCIDEHGCVRCVSGSDNVDSVAKLSLFMRSAEWAK